ncbi:MAG: hypothetical protein IRZ05_06425 [Micromonosporaceae bacterium]|nr:hypothetical protein [Micromonosporaceae bacterium]
MSNEPVRLSLSRRDIIRMSGGTALAAAALGALGLPAADDATNVPSGAPAPQAPRMRLAASGAQLLIRDGTPHWYESPDIWAVPGSDPNGPPGQPVAGDIAFVWARVANTGRDDAFGAQVRFYWANPSTRMRFSTIHLIGTAYADIPAGATQDVLCLVPWKVEFVNGGHECLVAVASMPDDPSLPDLVDPPAYPNVAQRNLTVFKVLKSDFHLMVGIGGGQQETQRVRLTAEIGGELPEEALATLGVQQTRPVTKPQFRVGLSLKPTEPGGDIGEPVLDVTVPPGQSIPVYVTVRTTGRLGPDEYQLLRLVERQDQQVLGGVSLVGIGG